MTQLKTKFMGTKSLLISGTYFPPQVGGISHYMGALASALGPCRVCCLTGVAATNGSSENGSTPKIYRRPSAFARSDYKQAMGWIRAITRIMIEEKPRVVQFATANEAYLGLWLRRWLKLPFVIYAHGNEVAAATREPWPKPRWALQSADRVFANSRFTAGLVEQVGVDPKRIDIIHPGCRTDHFRPVKPKLDLRRNILGCRERDRVLLTVGGLVARKGQDMVIRALPHVLRRIPNVVYVIVGDGPDRERLEGLAWSLGVKDRVVLAGEVNDRDLPDIYALSDVFVMPSRTELHACDIEGFGLVFLEANACGKPVIGGRSGGILDAIVEGETGLLVDPYEPEQIGNAIVLLLSDNELARRLGEQGRCRVTRDFTWRQVSTHVHNTIESIAQEGCIRPGN
jgi:phosphatidylinositol alpha-1,6-mannosyltransferase